MPVAEDLIGENDLGCDFSFQIKLFIREKEVIQFWLGIIVSILIYVDGF